MAAIWLMAQVATLAIAPAELWFRESSCQCSLGAGALCPMHHPSPKGRGTCAMHGTALLNDVVLTSLLGPAGCFLAAPAAPADWSVESSVLPSAEHLISRFAPPDLPPPRA